MTDIPRPPMTQSEPVPPKSYWMEFLAWEEEAAKQGSGLTHEQMIGAAAYRSWLVNLGPDDDRPESPVQPVLSGLDAALAHVRQAFEWHRQGTRPTGISSELMHAERILARLAATAPAATEGPDR